jgi:hypothetical protein
MNKYSTLDGTGIKRGKLYGPEQWMHAAICKMEHDSAKEDHT